MSKNSEKRQWKKLSHCVKTAAMYMPGSEIYGGIGELVGLRPFGRGIQKQCENAPGGKNLFRKAPYNVGLDSAILMNPQVWVASGHVGGFSDPLMDCKDCKTRHRADKLIEDADRQMLPRDGTLSRMTAYIVEEHDIKCPECGSQNFTDIRII